MGWEAWETFLEGMVWHKKTSGKCEWLMERSPWWDSGDADFDQKEGTHYSEDWMKIAWLEPKGEEGLFLAKLIRLWLQSRTWPGKEKVAWPCGRKDRVAMVTEISWFGEHLFWALLVKTLIFCFWVFGAADPHLTWVWLPPGHTGHLPGHGHSLWCAFPFFFLSFRSFWRRSSSASYIISWIRYFSLLIRSLRSFGRSGIR